MNTEQKEAALLAALENLETAANLVGSGAERLPLHLWQASLNAHQAAVRISEQVRQMSIDYRVRFENIRTGA